MLGLCPQPRPPLINLCSGPRSTTLEMWSEVRPSIHARSSRLELCSSPRLSTLEVCSRQGLICAQTSSCARSLSSMLDPCSSIVISRPTALTHGGSFVLLNTKTKGISLTYSRMCAVSSLLPLNVQSWRCKERATAFSPMRTKEFQSK